MASNAARVVCEENKFSRGAYVKRKKAEGKCEEGISTVVGGGGDGKINGENAEVVEEAGCWCCDGDRLVQIYAVVLGGGVGIFGGVGD